MGRQGISNGCVFIFYCFFRSGARARRQWSHHILSCPKSSKRPFLFLPSKTHEQRPHEKARVLQRQQSPIVLSTGRPKTSPSIGSRSTRFESSDTQAAKSLKTDETIDSPFSRSQGRRSINPSLFLHRNKHQSRQRKQISFIHFKEQDEIFKARAVVCTDGMPCLHNFDKQRGGISSSSARRQR